MNFVLTIYTEHIYQEIFLPELDNSDFSLHLRAADFALGDDVVLPMEVIDGQWFFKPSDTCRILCAGSSFVGQAIYSGQILRILTSLDETVAVMVWEKPSQITAYPK